MGETKSMAFGKWQWTYSSAEEGLSFCSYKATRTAKLIIKKKMTELCLLVVQSTKQQTHI